MDQHCKSVESESSGLAFSGSANSLEGSSDSQSKYKLELDQINQIEFQFFKNSQKSLNGHKKNLEGNHMLLRSETGDFPLKFAIKGFLHEETKELPSNE